MLPKKKIFDSYKDKEAIEHLMRVTTGLDSLVVGEKQILGQVRSAFERAQAAARMALEVGKTAGTRTSAAEIENIENALQRYAEQKPLRVNPRP